MLIINILFKFYVLIEPVSPHLFLVVDVVRTDSQLEFYEESKNLARMSDILAVYAWVDPSTGYCQGMPLCWRLSSFTSCNCVIFGIDFSSSHWKIFVGMSDLLSPFVVLFEDNADAFWCFEMLLRRMVFQIFTCSLFFFFL